MNYSDAERMATVLESLGYAKTENEKEADLFIVISCSVRESAALSIYGKVRDLNEMKEANPNFKAVLTGCVLEKDKKKLGKVFDIVMTMEDLPKLPELLTTCHPERSEGSRDSSATPQNDNYLIITPKYQSHFRAYVPISTGCDNFCTYCAVPYTKGREKSRPLSDIVNEVRNLVQNGYKEITLLGQNVNSYGNGLPNSRHPEPSEGSRTRILDSSARPLNDESFTTLLQKLDAIPGDHRIYFYSNHPKDMSDELIATLADLKHFPHYIHLPLQSGNDEIIQKMNRHYTKAQYLELVAKIRKAMPDVTLTTDIIVGFPGETEKQFADTEDVMEKAKYDMAFIAQYSSREGTVSAKQPDDVSKTEKTQREKVLQEIVKATVLAHNKKLISTTQRILVDEEKNGKYFGRTEGYKVVEITFPVIAPARPKPSEGGRSKATKQSITELQEIAAPPARNGVGNNKTDLVGRFVEVKIEIVSSWKLFGSIDSK